MEKGLYRLSSPMSNGGSLRFTVAKYFSPGGYVIHGKGLVPDVEVDLQADEQRDLRKSISNFGTIESLPPDDRQFIKAKDLLTKVLQSERKKVPFFEDLDED